MKRHLLSASAAAALTLAVAFGPAVVSAQDTTTGTTVAPAGAIDSTKLIGRNIVNANNDTVGEIESVVIDQDGQIRYVIVGVGGFLGLGERDVALAWDELTISENGEQVTINATKDQLAALPEHKFPEGFKSGTPYPYDEAVKTNPYLENRDVAATTTVTTSPEQMAPAAGTVGIGASKLVGATVKNAQGESIGEIHDVVLSNDGAAQGLMIDVGGFLGINERTVLVGWDDVTIQSDASGALVVATNLDKARLEQLPEYRMPATVQ